MIEDVLIMNRTSPQVLADISGSLATSYDDGGIITLCCKCNVYELGFID